MNKKLKVGLLGCGGIAQIAHLPALRKADNVEFTAICDAAEDLGRLMAKRYDVESVFTDHQEFLEKADMDAVLLPVAHAFHAPLSIACMRAGKHVLVEKPMALTVEECEQMAQVSDETGKQLQIACMKRYDPGLQFAQKFVAEEMGERLAAQIGLRSRRLRLERVVRTLPGNPHRRRMTRDQGRAYEHIGQGPEPALVFQCGSQGVHRLGRRPHFRR